VARLEEEALFACSQKCPKYLVRSMLIARGHLRIGEAASEGKGHPPDTFLDMTGWGKGLVWVNGFNLGWYWPLLGPQMTTYIPGPLLRAGDNELVLLEFSQQATDLSGTAADSMHA